MNNESLPGNPHYDDAAAAGRYYEARQIARDADVIALAQVEATLTLAFEQRTANLTAMTALVVECLNTKRGIDDESVAILNARLGLDGEEA